MTDTINGTRTTADELRELIFLFPRDLALHRKFILAVADEIDRLRALVGRQKNAAKRCLAIARDEAEVYRDCLAARTAEGNAEGVHAAQAAMVACHRIADRIEGEVVT